MKNVTNESYASKLEKSKSITTEPCATIASYSTINLVGLTLIVSIQCKPNNMYNNFHKGLQA